MSKARKALEAVATAVSTAVDMAVDTSSAVATAVSTAVDMAVAAIGRNYTVHAYHTSPARVSYSDKGAKGNIVAPLAHFATVPAYGASMTLTPVITEVAGITLHFAGHNSVGCSYRLPGQAGVWVVRTAQMPVAGAPPVMLRVDGPTLITGVRVSPTIVPAPLHTPHKLTVHSAQLVVVPDATE